MVTRVPFLAAMISRSQPSGASSLPHSLSSPSLSLSRSPPLPLNAKVSLQDNSSAEGGQEDTLNNDSVASVSSNTVTPT